MEQAKLRERSHLIQAIDSPMRQERSYVAAPQQAILGRPLHHFDIAAQAQIAQIQAGGHVIPAHLPHNSRGQA